MNIINSIAKSEGMYQSNAKSILSNSLSTVIILSSNASSIMPSRPTLCPACGSIPYG